MNTMQLSCFLAVAETLNFAKAAEQLNVTQPAVTQQIQSLEQELSVRLFHRTTRSVELTRAGAMFLTDAKTILDITNRARKRMEDTFEDTRKVFPIGCHAYNEIYQLAPVLEQLRERMPDIYPVFQVIPFRHLYQRVAEESVEVVVSFREGGLRKYLSYRELGAISLLAVAPASSPLAQKRSLTFGDLSGERLLLMEPHKSPGELGKLLERLLEERSARDVYLCDSIESCATLARAGYGVAVVPDLLPLRDSALAYLPIGDAEPLSYGAYYKKLSGRPVLRLFLTLAEQAFAGRGAEGGG